MKDLNLEESKGFRIRKMRCRAVRKGKIRHQPSFSRFDLLNLGAVKTLTAPVVM